MQLMIQPLNYPLTDSSGDYHVDPATPGDLEALAELLGRSNTWARYTAKRMRRDETWIWVARQDGRLAGLVDLHAAWIGQSTAGGRLKQMILGRQSQQADAILEPHQYGRITDLVIVDGAHYRDTGTALLNHCLRQMRHAQIEELRIGAAVKDEAAQAFYLSCGFETDRYFFAREVPQKTAAAEDGIRAASTDDLPQLAEMVRQEIVTQLPALRSLRLKANIDWRTYAAQKLQSPSTRILVYEENGRLGGYVEISLAAPGPRSIGGALRAAAGRRKVNAAAKQAHIEDIFVKDSMRRRGIAIRMLKQVDHACQLLGSKRVSAAVWANNRPSLALFRRSGFEALRVQLLRSV